MRGADVSQAADACRQLLGLAVGTSWEVPVPGLEFTVAKVVAHAAD